MNNDSFQHGHRRTQSYRLRIASREQIPGAIAKMQLAGAGHRVPLLQALYRGEIALLDVARDGSAANFKRWAAAARAPAVCVLGDDDGAVVAGPEFWATAARVLRWPKFALIHGGGGEPAHYHFVVDMARLHGRALLIECRSASIAAWAEAAERWAAGASRMVFGPPDGKVHPALAARPN